MSYIPKNEGNFFSTGEYANTIEYFNIHGVSFNQKVDSVKPLLDPNTIQILKVLIADNDLPVSIYGNTATKLEIITAFDIILSRLSKDNKSIIPTILSAEEVSQ